MDNTDKWLGEAVKTLQESESVYRGLFESLNEAVQISELIFNDDGKPVDVLMLNVNPAYEKQTGLKKEEVIGKPIKSILSVVEQVWLDRYAEIVHEGKSMHFEEYNEGTGRWFDVHASPLGGNRFAAVFTDITERKKAEEALKESEERYSTVFDSMTEAFMIGRLILDNEGKPYDFKYLSVNSVAASGYGMKPDEIENKRFIELFPDTEVPHLNEIGEAVLKGKISKNLESKSPITGNWLEIDVYPQKGNNFAVFTRIINEQKKTKEAKERLNALMDNNPSLIFMKDEHGKYVYLNKSYKKQFIHSNDWYGKTDFDFWPKESAELFQANDAEVLESGKIHQFMEDSTDMDGTRYVWLNYKFPFTDSKGKKYVGGIGIEATDHVRAEEALRESEERFRGFFELPLIGIAITSPEKGWIEANDKISEILGYSHEELFNTTWDEITYPDDIDKDIEQFNKVLDGSIDGYSLEKRFIRKDGSVIYTNISVECIRNVDNSVKYFVVLIEDITESKKAEEALLMSEDKFSKAFNNSPNAITITRLNDGKIIEGNESAYELFGYSHDEVIGKTTAELNIWANPDDRQKLAEGLASKGSIKNEEFILQKKDQSTMHVNLSASIITLDNQKCFLSSFIDITDRKKAEEKTKSILENIQEYYLEVDNEWRILDGNKKYEELFRLKKDDMVGKVIWELFPQTVGSKLYNQLHKSKNKNIPLHFEYKSILGGGKWFEAYAYPSKNGLISYGHDITERKKAEEEINRRNKLLKGINKIFEESLTCDTVEDIVGKCLDVAEDLTGSEFSFIGEINENGLLDDRALSPPGWEACTADHGKALESLSNMEIVSYWGRTIKEEKSQIVNDPENDPDKRGIPEGHPTITSFLGVPLKQGDKTIGMIALANKKSGYTTEDKNNIETLSGAFVEAWMRKKAELSLKEARDNLEEKVEERTVELEEMNVNLKENELELKDAIEELKRSNAELQSFAYITSHDLQEPLRSVASFAQLLQRRYKGQLDEDADDFIEFMVEGSIRMKDMIQALLEYSRIDRTGEEFTETDMNEMVEKAKSSLHSIIEDFNADITYENLPTVHAGPNQMERVLQNLIGNAIKFKKPQFPPRIHISSKINIVNNEFVFSVEDNGIGMEPQYSDKIFEVFKKLHTIAEYDGTGIGLSIVKKIIETNGGRIWVESELDKGSTFYFTIPFKNE